MKLTYGILRQMVDEALKEQNVSGAVGGFNSPRAFKSTGRPFSKSVSRPKRPSHTKMFDYI